MGYAIIGVGKICSMAKMNAASEHNLRQTDVPNADKNLEHLNDELISTNGKSYTELFQEKINSLEYYQNHKPRSNAVLAIEVEMSFSREDKKKIDIEKWKKDNVEWLKGYFNKTGESDNVSVSAILSCRPFFILIFLRCIKMKHYGFSRKSIWKNLETFP